MEEVRLTYHDRFDTRQHLKSLLFRLYAMVLCSRESETKTFPKCCSKYEVSASGPSLLTPCHRPMSTADL